MFRNSLQRREEDKGRRKKSVVSCRGRFLAVARSSLSLAVVLCVCVARLLCF